MVELERAQVGAGVSVGVMAQLRFTVPENDPVGAKAKLKLAVCPALMVWEVGDPEPAPMVKSGAAWTTSETGTLFTIEPELPWTCTEYVLAARLAFVVMVRVDVPELLAIEGGLKAQVAPVGSPVQESGSAPSYPKVGVTVTVDVAEEPAVTVPGFKAAADSAKPAGVVLSNTATPLTVSVMLVFSGTKTRSGRPSPFISAT
jgi:hypothetical protein